MTSQHIVLLGPNAAQCERARARGLAIIVLDTAAQLAPGVIELADHVILTDYADFDLAAALLRPFTERYSLLGVLSLTEHGLLPSARLNQHFGFIDNDVSAVERVMDKNLMRTWLDMDPRFRLPSSLVTTISDLRRFIGLVDFPVIVKPADGAGSEGLVLIASQSELDLWESCPSRLPVLAERFVTGAEYSVEAYSRDGEHTVVAITEKLVHTQGVINKFVESGHCVPAPLPEPARLSIEEFVKDFLIVIGIRWGLSHTELIATADGLVIVETHTRNGGDRIVDLVRLSTGVDLLDVAVAIRSGQHYQPDSLAPSQAAAVRFLIIEPGIVQSVTGADVARRAAGVVDVQLLVGSGDTVNEVSSSDDRVGAVIAIGASPSEASDRAEHAAEAIHFAYR